MSEPEIKPCPFCGAEAKVLHTHEDGFQIVGCATLSMLCPNPCVTVYKKQGKFDYTYWNKRAES